MTTNPEDKPERKIVARIEKETGATGLLKILAESLAPTDLQSMLMEAFRKRAVAIDPARLFAQYAENRFVAPCRTASPRVLMEIDRLAFEALPPGYEALDLSPVSPLGSHSVIATVDQNKVVTTVRNTEVVADPTNVLALESALRRRTLSRDQRTSRQHVKLCASHRVLRAQHFGASHLSAHFKLLALTAAGRDEGGRRFEVKMLLEQLDYFLRLIQAVAITWNTTLIPRIAVTDLSDGLLTPAIQEQVFDRLRSIYPKSELGFDPTRQKGRGYYTAACFKIHCTGAHDAEQEIGDGGFTDWTRKLLSNQKERFLTGCLAQERMLQIAQG